MKAVINAQEFKRLIKNTKNFTYYNKSVKSIMSYIELKAIKSDMKIIATAVDGHRISIENANAVEIDESFTCYIKPTIPKITKYDEYVEIEIKDNKTFITVADSLIGYRHPEGRFPDVEKIISNLEKDEPAAKIGFNPALLKDALTAANDSYYGRALCKMEIRKPEQPIIIKSKVHSCEKENIKIVLPVTCEID